MKSPVTFAQLLTMVGLLACVGAACAETHALILWIGNYAEPSAKLQGIAADRTMALRMAELLGATRGRTIRDYGDRDLTLPELTRHVRSLATLVRQGDRVIIYFTGHGSQSYRDENACSEGLVAYDSLVYSDDSLQEDLKHIARTAAQVVMFNDSCHSGGAATKSFGLDDDGFQVKVYPLPQNTATAKAGPTIGQRKVCGEQINYKAFRGLIDSAENRIVHIAASADNEAAIATPKGSLATMAWLSCLESTAAQRRATITGAELSSCAQSWLDQFWKPRRSSRPVQHITPALSVSMPIALSFR